MTFAEFDSLVGQDSYVLCRGKERISKDVVSYEIAQRHIDKGGQVGWWVTSGHIVVDIDEGRDQAVKSIKAFGLQTLICKTPKGLHLYFKTSATPPQKVGMIMPFGLKADYRCANKGYVILPWGSTGRGFNKAREIAHLPTEFTPLANRQESLYNLVEGDGRNAKLFAHLMAYKNRGATDEQVEAVANFINTTIFATTLAPGELSKIVENTRKYKAAEGGENPFLLYNAKGHATGVNYRAIVDHFVNEGGLYVLGGETYSYTEGVYRESSAEVRNKIREMIQLDAHITQGKILQAFQLLVDDTRLHKNPDDINSNYKVINFKNGLYDIDARTLKPHSPDEYTTIQIPHNYEIKSKPFTSTLLYKFLADECDLYKEDIDMLLDYMAYMLTTDYGLKTFMVLLGPSNTGKSVLIRFLTAMIGSHNASALSMHELNMKFYPTQLYGKLMNACADNSALPLQSIENLKKITGGDRIMHEKKGKDPYFFVPFSKLIFSFNQMPLQLEEKSNAFYMRMRVLSMVKQLHLNNEYVERLCSSDSIEQVIPHLVSRLPLEKVARTKRSIKQTSYLRQDSDSVHAFMTQKVRRNKNATVLKSDLYNAYIDYCVNNGREAHKKHAFMRHMRALNIEEGRNPQACWVGIRLKQKRS